MPLERGRHGSPAVSASPHLGVVAHIGGGRIERFGGAVGHVVGGCLGLLQAHALHLVGIGGVAFLARFVLAAILLAFLGVLVVVGIAAAVLAHVERVEQIVDRIAEPALVLDARARAGRGRGRRVSSISGRHRSTSFLAAGGGARPVSRSRTIMATASSIGASARSVTSSYLPRWKRSSSMAARFCATPSMRRAPIASTRACSTASNTARACWPPGTQAAVHRRDRDRRAAARWRRHGRARWRHPACRACAAARAAAPCRRPGRAARPRR